MEIERKIKVFISIGIATFLFVLFFYLEVQNVLSNDITEWTEDVEGDCAVVLTGSPGRVRAGVDLLTRGHARRLILSGVHPTSTLREIIPELPFYGDLPADKIYLERHSSTTYGNVKQSLALVQRLKCRDVIVVTSHLHMYRAVKIFKKVFPKDFPLKSLSIKHGHGPVKLSSILLESYKSLFYALWAY